MIELKRGVAQLVARSVRDAEVVGSIPVASTKNGIYALISCINAVFGRKIAKQDKCLAIFLINSLSV